MWPFKSKSNFFTREDEKKIILAIRNAEGETSGEIRVHIQHFLRKDILDEATETFYRLKMDKTQYDNGVLFFIVPEAREFAVIGAKGIHEVVEDNFWTEISTFLTENFKQGQFTNSICEAVAMAGQQLKSHFPHDPTKENELPDEISYS